MNDADELLAGGAYAQKQIFSKSRLIAWSHLSRFRMGRKLIAPYAGHSLLDYGCGDGTFLAMVHDLFPSAVGADVDPKQTRDCTSRFAEVPGLSFILTDELAEPRLAGAYDVIVCMEVLEHCVETVLTQILSELRRLVAPTGTVVISVPIEIGPSLIAKQLARTVAGWRGLGDYKYRETYTTGEFWKMVFAGKHTSIERPTLRADFDPDRPNFYHGHKGFNWRALRARLEQHFTIDRTCFSPLGWLGGFASSQAWFRCKPR